MAEDTYNGRRPSFGAHGGIRAFRSRPGAPMADLSRNVGGASYGPLLKGLTPMTNWDSMFHNFVTGANPSGAAGVPGTPGYQPKGTTSPGLADISADEQFGGGTKPATGAAGPTGAPSLQSMANPGGHAAIWSVPPRRGPDRSMPAAPFMPQDPSRPFHVPDPLTGPLGDAGSDRANYGANAGMYLPGGATGFWGGTVNPSGWQGPTGRGVAPGDYTTPYGSARVDKMVPGTKSYGWGGSFEDRSA